MKEIAITAELIKEKEGGYTVYCPELDIYTQGDGVEDALRNLKEAKVIRNAGNCIKSKSG